MIAADTGIDAATNSEDRRAALARLNHAYRQIMQQGGGIPGAVLLTAPAGGLTDIDVVALDPTLGSRFLAIDRVRLRKGGSYSDSLARSTPGDIRDAQNDAPSGTPGAYSFVYPMLYLDRALDGATDIALDVRLSPLDLVETAAVTNASEETPSALPPVWHERLLASLACVLILERYEGREQDAAYHRGLYNEALAEYRYNRAREGGADMPGSHGNLWATPNIVSSR